ncbi:MAG: FAD-binding protein [Candidatus Bathyarchaeota archaeon]|nr:MAG: FAD-binding protein [Candidatus Bathyarchaeota archaeon]
MKYRKVNERVLKQLAAIVEPNDILSDRERILDYASDESSIEPHYPEVVVRTNTTEEVSKILRLANQELIPVTPRGGGTGLCGGAVPIYGGILISFEKMNQILELDAENLMITVEPGVFVLDLHTYVEEHDLLYPPDPGQKLGTIGGNISTNAGGMRGVKYGVTRDFVQGLEVVLPTSEIIDLGGKTVKNSTGYSLIDLIIGAEGTLGVITKAILRLVPLSKLSSTLYVPYKNLQDASSTVSKIIQNKIIPPAIEFVDQSSILVAERYLKRSMPRNDAPAYVLIRIEDKDETQINADIEAVGEICLENNALDVLVADTRGKQEEIWEGRSCIIDAAKAEGLVEVVDCVVPRASIPALIKGLNDIAKKYGVECQNFGHAGDGNVHTNILKKTMNDDEWNNKIPHLLLDIYTLSVSLHGTISGEHGIGLTRKQYFPMARDEKQIELMKEIKRVFDPNNILNPGKIFDLD